MATSPSSKASKLPAGAAASTLDLLAETIKAGVGAPVVDRIAALYEFEETKRKEAAFFTALSAFQGEMPVVPKSATVRVKSKSGAEYSYNYAPLDEIIEAATPLLAKQGLSFTVQIKWLAGDNGGSYILCRVTVHHVAGHSVSSEFQAPVDHEARMNDMQKVASAQTYAKRYAICNALGILTGESDDDGQEGGDSGHQDQTKGSAGHSQNKRTGNGAGVITAKQRGLLFAKIKEAGLDQEYVHERLEASNLGVTSFNDIPKASLDKIIELLPKWLEQKPKWEANRQQAQPQDQGSPYPDLPDHLVDYWIKVQDIHKTHGKQAALDEVARYTELNQAELDLLSKKVSALQEVA